MKGFISECNVPSFWPTILFCVQHLLSAPHCLSRIVEKQFSCPVSARRVLCSLQLDCRGAHPLACFFSQLRGVCFCRSPSPLFKMADPHIWISAYLPHPFRQNQLVQMYWKEERQSGSGPWGAGVPLPCDSVPILHLRRGETLRCGLCVCRSLEVRL